MILAVACTLMCALPAIHGVACADSTGRSAIRTLEIHGSPQFQPPRLTASPRDSLLASFDVTGRDGQSWQGVVQLDARTWSLWAVTRECAQCAASCESPFLLANAAAFVRPPWRLPRFSDAPSYSRSAR